MKKLSALFFVLILATTMPLIHGQSATAEQATSEAPAERPIDRLAEGVYDLITVRTHSEGGRPDYPNSIPVRLKRNAAGDWTLKVVGRDSSAIPIIVKKRHDTDQVLFQITVDHEEYFSTEIYTATLSSSFTSSRFVQGQYFRIWPGGREPFSGLFTLQKQKPIMEEESNPVDQ